MLEGKNAIITGGVRGIGAAIAEEFCRNGANVMLCYRSNEEAAEKALTGLSVYGTKIELSKGDVADPRFAEKTVKMAKEAFGSIEILVNNAGVTNDKLIMRMGNDDFKEVIDANLNGAFYFLRETSLVMVKQRYGRIINMSSIAGVKGNPGQINYCASKAGIIGMTLSAAKELGRRGITVNAVAPGFIDTDMTRVLTEDQKTASLAAISLGRVGTPQDIAGAVLFLASDAASYITGQVIGVDGGMNI